MESKNHLALAEPAPLRVVAPREIDLPADVMELIEQNAALAREAGLIGYGADPLTLLRRVLRLACG